MEYNFDSALKRLNEIADKLDSGSCSLEESIKLYEEGVKLSAECEKLLANAKQKVEYIESGVLDEN